MFFFDEEMIENKPNRTSIERFTIKGLLLLATQNPKNAKMRNNSELA